MPYKKFIRLLTPIDIITLGYIILTGIYIILCSYNLDKYFINIEYRILFITIILMLIFVNSISSIRIVRFFRHFYPLALLLYLYPETASINNFLFIDLDSLVAKVETGLFGGYPSVLFSRFLPWKWFSEIMNFGYFSYFPLILIFCFIMFRKSFKNFSFTIFVICMSFYMYYFLFILFPVAGPQYYFVPPYNQIPDGYLFSYILKYIQHVGEGPTGAFPSSHIGIISILIWLIYKFRPTLLKWYIPVSILLCLSTVYIKAHYVVDVIAGFLSAPIMYWISSRTYYIIYFGLKKDFKIRVIFDNLKLFIRTINDPSLLSKYKQHYKIKRGGSDHLIT